MGTRTHAPAVFRRQVNGVALHVEERGQGDPILCIHGTGSSTELWSDAAKRLAAHGRTIIYDRRGFGRSERSEAPAVGVPEHVADAAALLDALDASPAIVIGRSYGGEVALELALRHPDRVRALALLEGGGLSLGDELGEWIAKVDARLDEAAQRDPDSVGETLMREVLGDDGWEAMPETAQAVFVANSAAILAEERAGMPDVDPAELAEVRCPVLLIGATSSPPPFRQVVQRVADALPASRVTWAEGDHLIDPAHPAVLDFVDEVVQGRAPAA
jgi:esterase